MDSCTQALEASNRQAQAALADLIMRTGKVWTRMILTIVVELWDYGQHTANFLFFWRPKPR
jgi:hypothetical protein